MSCGRCHKHPCECNKCGPATPTPFYDCSPVCEEDNCERVYVRQNTLGLLIASSWNIPEVGGAALIQVPDTVQMPVGQYLFNPTFGYFLINSFDSLAQTISVSNTGIEGNAPPGTEVPKCTVFTIGPKPCCSGVNDGCDKLAADFTAPAIGDSLNIALTSVNNLIAGNNVEIGSAIYALTAILPNNVITIQNNGDGAIPGTIIYAKDLAGNFVVCVNLLTVNACDNTGVLGGEVLVCHDNLQTILLGNSDGEFLKLIDHVTGAAAYAPIPTNYSAEVNAASTPITTPFALTNTQSTASGVITATLTNPSTTQNMVGLFSVTGNFEGEETIDGDAVIQANLETDQNGGGYTTVATTLDEFFGTGDVYQLARVLSWDIAVLIPPSSSYILGAQLGLAQTKVSGAAATFDLHNTALNLVTRISAIGVAV